MKVGLQVSNFTWPAGPAKIQTTLAEIARATEAAGFDSLWVMDHFFQIAMVGPAENDMLEGYGTLSYLAALTKKIKLGTLATGVIYRYPGLLVKTVTTLDVLSQGRAWFCIGAGWFEREAKGLGVPFPPISARFEMLEEALLIAKQMWSANNGAFRGKHYQLEETLCNPPPVSRPYPPIMVAGGGEKKTLRLVAQYADACNIFGTPEVIKAKLAILKRHCDSVGRDYASIETTTLASAHLAPGKMSAKDVIAQCKALAAMGIQHVIFSLPNAEEIKPFEIFGREIVPTVAGY
jgi:F420-dependent oxidoreductase-like protein